MDPGRQHHNCVLIENDIKLQSQFTHDREHSALVRTQGSNNNAPGRYWRPSAAQLSNEGLRRPLSQQTLTFRHRIVKNGTVFCDHAGEKLKMRTCGFQISEVASSNHDQLAAGCNEAIESSQGWVAHHSISGESAIVIRSECKISHDL